MLFFLLLFMFNLNINYIVQFKRRVYSGYLLYNNIPKVPGRVCDPRGKGQKSWTGRAPEKGYLNPVSTSLFDLNSLLHFARVRGLM